MGYSLGIDIGAATCAAAIRDGAAWAPCHLGESGPTMPAVALPRPDGTTLVGEAADRHTHYEPTLVARMVSARLDEPGPVLVDDTPHDPLALTEALIGTVIDRSAPVPGDVPDHVVVAYPLRAGDAPRAVLAEAAERVAGGAVTLVPAPVAAAAKLAHDGRLPDGAVVAVVDAGASSVDVTLVHRSPDTFDLVGDPACLGFGGVDLDAAMLSLVEGAIGDLTSTVRPGDRNGMLALRRLRSVCRAAKEALSTEPAAVVDVALPHARGRVEVTREALEGAIEPQVAEVADLVLATIEGAALTPGDVAGVVLTGGSARVPLLAAAIGERTGLPVTVDDAPDLATALGAALFGTDGAGAARAAALGAAPPPGPVDTGPLDTGTVHTGPVDTGPLDTGPLDTGPAGPAAPNPFDTGGHAPSTGGHPALTTGEAPAVGGHDLAGWPTFEQAADGGWDGAAADQAQPWDGAAADQAQPWDDGRTSVFDPPAGAPVGPGDEDGEPEWGQPAVEEFQRLRTSDTDPFLGRGPSLSSRLRERRREQTDADLDDEDDAPGLDVRIVVGSVIAAVVVVAVGGYALAVGSGGSDDPAIAVADTSATTLADPSATVVTVTTTTEATTTTTEATTTSRPRRTTTTAAPAPPPPPPPTNPPPTTSPPPPRPPRTTTTTAPTTTTSTTTTTTTTTESDPGA
ncbi:MAG TPA: Hsp70 family protein [Acidimicrobiales bacterium]